MRPTNSATKAVRGRSYSSAGGAICSSRPADMTPTRSPSASASSWSWVTNRVVVPTAIWILPDLLAQLPAHLRVQRREGLVEEEHLRLDRERPGEGDPLLLAARHLVRISVGLLLEPDELEHRSGPLAALVLAHAPQAQPVGDVVDARHVGEQAVRLEDDAHAALARRDVRDVLAVDEDPAAVDLVEPAERPQRGRLAAPGRTEEGDELARGDVDRQSVEGVDRPYQRCRSWNWTPTPRPVVAGAGLGAVMSLAPPRGRVGRPLAPGAKRAMM